MNCAGFRQHVIEFADGRLGEPENAQAIAHARRCAVCAARVEDFRSFKRSMSRTFAATTSTSDHVDAVRRAIHDARSDAPVKIAGWQRFVVPLGMAAAIVFVWLISPLIDDAQSPASTRITSRLVSAVVQTHENCLAHGHEHHRAGLPRDPFAVGRIMSAELGFPVCAPDLAAAGFDFHSADACGFAGRDAAHLEYQRSADGRVVSLFSVKRIIDFKPMSTPAGSKRPYFVCPPGVDVGESLVAWIDGGTTCVLCGELGVEELLKLAERCD